MPYKAWIGIGDDPNWGKPGFRRRCESLINPMLVDPTWWTFNMHKCYADITGGQPVDHFVGGFETTRILAETISSFTMVHWAGLNFDAVIKASEKVSHKKIWSASNIHQTITRPGWPVPLYQEGIRHQNKEIEKKLVQPLPPVFPPSEEACPPIPMMPPPAPLGPAPASSFRMPMPPPPGGPLTASAKELHLMVTSAANTVTARQPERARLIMEKYRIPPQPTRAVPMPTGLNPIELPKPDADETNELHQYYSAKVREGAEALEPLLDADTEMVPERDANITFDPYPEAKDITFSAIEIAEFTGKNAEGQPNALPIQRETNAPFTTAAFNERPKNQDIHDEEMRRIEATMEDLQIKGCLENPDTFGSAVPFAPARSPPSAASRASSSAASPWNHASSAG